MEDQLLIRAYNVGLGDCIYLRIPDGDQRRHVLIDCGSKNQASSGLRRAVDHLREELSKDANGSAARLDLLVVTHAHEDHLCGFGEGAAFQGIQVSRVWMSVAMDPNHPQAEKAKQLHTVAQAALVELAASPQRGVADWAESMLALANADAVNYLLGGKLQVATFVHAESQPDSIFQDERIRFHVIAPEPNIDGIYLGRETELDLDLLRLAARSEGAPNGQGGGGEAVLARPIPPSHVCAEDFAQLREGMVRQSMAFVQKNGELINNTSVVLLLEWHGRRLLFTGDAEFSEARQGVFTEDAANGSWNTMWAKRKEHFQPIDFLKVGHHGSENATPWTRHRPKVNEILDALLPSDGKSSTRAALVSTARTNVFPTIPDPFLMEELGKRVGNAVTTYVETPNKGHFVAAGIPQPVRTDLERRDGQEVGFVEVKFSALS